MNTEKQELCLAVDQHQQTMCKNWEGCHTCRELKNHSGDHRCGEGDHTWPQKSQTAGVTTKTGFDYHDQE